MYKPRKIKGSGRGVVLTVWLSEETKELLQITANRCGKKISALAREILESAVNKSSSGESN